MFKQFKKSSWTPGMACSNCGLVTRADMVGRECRACGKPHTPDEVVKFRIVSPTILRQLLLIIKLHLPEFATIELQRKEQQ